MEEKLEPGPVVVNAPSLPKPFRAPFEFRNGWLNLIDAMAFEGMSGSEVFNRTSIHAVEGQLLAEYKESPYGDLGLIVVGKFGADQKEDRRRAAEVFERHAVVMHTFAALEGLIEQIRREAHRV